MSQKTGKKYRNINQGFTQINNIKPQSAQRKKLRVRTGNTEYRKALREHRGKGVRRGKVSKKQIE
ncbi:MAG: hypothetical protein PHX21_04155 [bacterium]|nr:hypothetical protein [bacterium]